MTERQMWEALAEQLEGHGPSEMISGVWREVEDPEFLNLLTISLGVDSSDTVRDVLHHPHYPGNELRCHKYWCEMPLWDRCKHEENGRCPYFRRPKDTVW